jgi:MraZ protein
MFRGLTAINVDGKGRIMIPTQYRAAIADESGGSLVLTIDTIDPCLLLYPFPQWRIIEEKLEQLSSFQPATRRIKRLLLGHATELQLDSHGRILLPSLLREYASLEKTMILVGQGKKFELWGEEQWKQNRGEWLSLEAKQQEELPPELLSFSL